MYIIMILRYIYIYILNTDTKLIHLSQYTLHAFKIQMCHSLLLYEIMRRHPG